MKNLLKWFFGGSSTDKLLIIKLDGNAVLFLLLFNVSLIVVPVFFTSLFPKNIMKVKIFGIYVLIYNFLKSLKVIVFLWIIINIVCWFPISIFIWLFWLTSYNKLLVTHFSFLYFLLSNFKFFLGICLFFDSVIIVTVFHNFH